MRDPGAAAILSDFDGTLAPIVDDPATAKPSAGVVEVLERLATRVGLVGVVSGRPLEFLRERLGFAGGRALRLAGLYGLEWLDEEGRVRTDEAALVWREAIGALAAEAAAEAPAGLVVERKGLALTLHWRREPAAAGWARDFAARGARVGVAVVEGRMSLELRPPIGANKASVVRSWAGGRKAVAFFGDDRGDLAAFRAVEELVGQTGAVGVRVAVASEEAPPELIEEADVVLDGPGCVLEVLEALARLLGT